MRKRKKIVSTIYLEVAQSELLDLLSDSTRVPKSEYIREGLHLIRERYKDTLEQARRKAKGGAA